MEFCKRNKVRLLASHQRKNYASQKKIMNVRHNNRPFTMVFFVFFFEIVLGVKLSFSFVDFYVAALRLVFPPKSAFNLHFYYETK